VYSFECQQEARFEKYWVGLILWHLIAYLILIVLLLNRSRTTGILELLLMRLSHIRAVEQRHFRGYITVREAQGTPGQGFTKASFNIMHADNRMVPSLLQSNGCRSPVGRSENASVRLWGMVCFEMMTENEEMRTQFASAMLAQKTFPQRCIPSFGWRVCRQPVP
jgi:hypothetical protein